MTTPPLPQMPPDLAPVEHARKDAEQLRLLWIFHFVFAGLAVLGIGFLVVHYLFMKNIFANPAMWRGAQQPPPPQFFQFFIIFYFIAGFVIVLGAALNAISAACIRNRKWRLFSLVVAGIDCLQVPFGTALGVCTFLVLLRESVRRLYEAPSATPYPTGQFNERR